MSDTLQLNSREQLLWIGKCVRFSKIANWPQAASFSSFSTHIAIFPNLFHFASLYDVSMSFLFQSIQPTIDQFVYYLHKCQSLNQSHASVPVLVSVSASASDSFYSSFLFVPSSQMFVIICEMFCHHLQSFAILMLSFSSASTCIPNSLMYFIIDCRGHRY